MPPLDDPKIQETILEILRNHHVCGEIVWREQAQDELRSDCECTVEEVNKALHRHVENGGAIDAVPEARPEWAPEWDFHYDFRIKIESEKIYVETRLDGRSSAKDPHLWVVSLHKGWQ